MYDYQRELDVALVAVRAAARVCRNVQSSIAPTAMEKQDRSPVTIADFASQAVVCHTLKAMFPRDPVLGEENADDLRGVDGEAYRSRIQLELARIDVHGDEDTILGWIDHGCGEPDGRFWTLDPIDGTKGFLRREQYAVSLALIEHGEVKVGVVACPNLPMSSRLEEQRNGAILYAVRGGGAVSDLLDASYVDEERSRIHVSDNEDPTRTLLCESVETGHSSHGWSARVAEALGTRRFPIRLDSQAKYAVVATGGADAYLRLPTRPGYQERIWDHAGGVIVVEEAGGRVTDVDGKPLDFGRGGRLDANRGVVVTNGHLHDVVLQAVAEAENGE